MKRPKLAAVTRPYFRQWGLPSGQPMPGSISVRYGAIIDKRVPKGFSGMYVVVILHTCTHRKNPSLSKIQQRSVGYRRRGRTAILPPPSKSRALFISLIFAVLPPFCRYPQIWPFSPPFLPPLLISALATPLRKRKFYRTSYLFFALKQQTITAVIIMMIMSASTPTAIAIINAIVVSAELPGINTDFEYTDQNLTAEIDWNKTTMTSANFFRYR